MFPLHLHFQSNNGPLRCDDHLKSHIFSLSDHPIQFTKQTRDILVREVSPIVVVVRIPFLNFVWMMWSWCCFLVSECILFSGEWSNINIIVSRVCSGWRRKHSLPLIIRRKTDVDTVVIVHSSETLWPFFRNVRFVYLSYSIFIFHLNSS